MKQPTLDEELAALTRRSVWQKLIDGLFGYDFFISYRWEDGRIYALKLASELKERGFNCFLDSDSYAKGENWKTSGALAIRRTSRLVLVGSPCVLKSGPVLREVRIFSRSGRKLIPIDFANTLSAQSLHGHPLGEFVTSDILKIDEDVSRLKEGPSQETLKELQKTFDCERQSTRRLRALKLAMGSLFLIATFAILAASISFQAKRTADRVAAERQAELDKVADANRREQERQRSEASSVQLAAKALGVLAENRELAMLVAMEAVKIASTREAEHALRKTLVEPVTPVVLHRHTHRSHRPIHRPGHSDAQFSSDGKRILSVGADGARLVNAITADTLQTFSLNPDSFTDMMFATLSSDDKRVLIMEGPISFAHGYWETKKPIQLYDAGTGKLLIEVQEKFAARVALSPDNSQLVTAGFDTHVKIWDAHSGKLRFDCGIDQDGHEQRVTAASFSSNGKWIVTASWDGTARIWEASTGRILKTLPIKKQLEWADFSPDAHKVLILGGESADDDRFLYLWGWESGGSATLTGHTEIITDAVFSFDSKRLATASVDGTARIWDAITGNCLQVLSGHKDFVNGVAFSPNGEWVASASGDGTVRIWNTSSGENLIDLVQKEGAFVSAAFSPDGKQIVTVRTDERGQGDVLIYPCEVCASFSDLLGLAQSRAKRELTPKERQSLGLSAAR